MLPRLPARPRLRPLVVCAVVGFLQVAERIGPAPASIGVTVLKRRILHMTHRIVDSVTHDVIVVRAQPGAAGIGSPGRPVVGRCGLKEEMIPVPLVHLAELVCREQAVEDRGLPPRASRACVWMKLRRVNLDSPTIEQIDQWLSGDHLPWNRRPAASWGFE